MSYNSAFSPFGPTYLVGTSSVQVKTNNNNYPSSYRVKNLLTTNAYLAWLPQEPNDAAVTVSTATAPSAGVPSVNTLGLLPNSVEIFSGIPPNAWFIGSAAGAFEITPGEGL
jgi:hypothetical protein